ncbi:MAG: ribonuclease HII [Candidatus Iainarchaeum archaeon]|uniref:Ribonuclease HII n=1 Tax=Candidatus Iainarchaeum sp. TaxID=3101447 RepID=A0A497JIR3_9ARCH|nr:MAG: ribonuclease HII [Candidatus Diapherotrites archaeon]
MPVIAGIDEAGRGCCIGPLVMAVATIDIDNLQKLSEIGVKDSKELSPKKRENLFSKLKKILKEYKFVKIEAAELNSLMLRKSLNEIEAIKAAYLLQKLEYRPLVAYIDSPDPLQSNFAKRIKNYLEFPLELYAYHKADQLFPIVSAASIIAKVVRDRAIEKLAKAYRQYGNLGSGYAHDEFTIAFLKRYVKKNKKLPEFARTEWITTQRILDNEFQRKLF